MAESRERARETEEGDDRWGPRVSERKGECAREQATRMGRVAGPHGRERARPWARCCRLFGWAEPEEGRGVGPS
jgi:hypothetical protein